MSGKDAEITIGKYIEIALRKDSLLMHSSVAPMPRYMQEDGSNAGSTEWFWCSQVGQVYALAEWLRSRSKSDLFGNYILIDSIYRLELLTSTILSILQPQNPGNPAASSSVPIVIDDDLLATRTPEQATAPLQW